MNAIAEWTPTIEQYHADLAISHSSLELFRRDPALFHGIRTGKFPRKVTDAMKDSTVVHTALLEPERFALQSVDITPDVLTSNGARRDKAWGAFKEENEGKFLLRDGEREQIVSMQESLRSHSKARQLLYLMDGDVERSCKWEDATTGLDLRARFDKLIPEAGIIVDLKTIVDARPPVFAAQAHNLGYHRQAAFYLDAAVRLGLQSPVFVFICIEKEPPYSVEVFEMDSDWVQMGRDENWRDLWAIRECQESGRWLTPTHGSIVNLSAPRWARFESQARY